MASLVLCCLWAAAGCTLIAPLEEPEDPDLLADMAVAPDACMQVWSSAYISEGLRANTVCTRCLCDRAPSSVLRCQEDCWALIACVDKQGSACMAADDPESCAATYCEQSASELKVARRLLGAVDACSACPVGGR